MKYAWSQLTCAAALLWAPPLCTQTAPLPATIELHGLAQIWYAGESSANTFRVRRAELKLSGRFNEDLLWAVQVDPSKSGNIFQDALMSYRVDKRIFIDAGQFKLPFSREGLESSSRIETVERTLFASTTNKMADIRSIGIQVRAATGNIGLQVGAFNDLTESSNRVDNDRSKALTARVTMGVVPHLTLGASGAVTVGPAAESTGRSRAGGDVQYASSRVTLRSELLFGKDSHDDRLGYYALAAYRLLPVLEGAVRYDVWDSDVGSDADQDARRERDYVGALSYLLNGHAAKVQLAVLRKTFAHGSSEATTQLLLNAQAAW